MSDKGVTDWKFGYKPCAAGHVFTWMGGIHESLDKLPEGTPCLCGQMLAHWVPCPTCGHERNEPVPR
jgi:hypothetical protein